MYMSVSAVLMQVKATSQVCTFVFFFSVCLLSQNLHPSFLFQSLKPHLLHEKKNIIACSCHKFQHLFFYRTLFPLGERCLRLLYQQPEKKRKRKKPLSLSLVLSQKMEMESLTKRLKFSNILSNLFFFDSSRRKQHKFGDCFLRGKKGEDRWFSHVEIFKKNGGSVYAYGVIDGHGGEETADFLAKEFPKVLRLLCEQRSLVLESDLKSSKEAWGNLLRDSFKFCNQAWDTLVLKKDASKKSGAVMTVVLVSKEFCLISHVGDGKVIASSEQGFAELTREHRASDPLEKKRIEKVGGEILRNRVKGILEPSRTFGDMAIRIDSNGKVNNRIITPRPDISFFEIDMKGFLVICTDGLHDVLPTEEITSTIQKSLQISKDLNLAAKFVCEQAAKHTEDDISCIILFWE